MTIFVGRGKSRRTEDYCIAVDKIIESTKDRTFRPPTLFSKSKYQL